IRQARGFLSSLQFPTVTVRMSISFSTHGRCCNMRPIGHMRLALCIVFVASFVFAAIPASAQAGGEVADVNMKVTHITSSIGAKTPADRIDLTLRLRVVDEAGHEASGTARFVDDGEFHSVLSEERKSASNVKRWLKDGPERRLLLIELYI